MNWAVTIEHHRSALLRIVAGLIVTVGALTVEHLPRKVYGAVLKILRPAESAVRRLIVIAAHGLEVKPSAARPFPANLKRTGKPKRERAPQFQLFDTRKRFFVRRRQYFKPGAGPRITFFPVDDDPRIPLFRPPVPQAVTIELCPARTASDSVPAKSLCRRLTALKEALDNIPKHAQRLARWQVRRNRMKNAKFRDPLRPGRAPGARKRPIHEIDDILRDCQWLAFDRRKPDSS